MPASRRRVRRNDCRSSCVLRAAESAEDLPPDWIVPVPESAANGARPGGPRAASQDFVFGTEELLRVFLVRKALKAGIAVEVARCPFPHVADHSIACLLYTSPSPRD